MIGYLHLAGQIIATSHDLTPNGGLVREIPLFQGNLGWWNIIIWPEWYDISIWSYLHIQSRELTYSTLGKGKSSTQKCLGMEYVSSQGPGISKYQKFSGGTTPSPL